jgi:hypothetical protein
VAEEKGTKEIEPGELSKWNFFNPPGGTEAWKEDFAKRKGFSGTELEELLEEEFWSGSIETLAVTLSRLSGTAFSFLPFFRNRVFLYRDSSSSKLFTLSSPVSTNFRGFFHLYVFVLLL